MKEEILSIADEALRAIDEFENYLFANHRAKYAMSKSILDQHREHIFSIKKGLELGLDDAGFNDVRSDLSLIIDDVNNARYGNTELKEPEIDTTEVDQMLDSLKEDKVETEFPKEDINLNGINDAISTLENTPIAEVQSVVEPAQPVESVTTVPTVPEVPTVPVVETTVAETTTTEITEAPAATTVVEIAPVTSVVQEVPTIDAVPTAQPMEQNIAGMTTPQVDVTMVPQIDMSNDIDVNALDAFMNTQTQQ